MVGRDSSRLAKWDQRALQAGQVMLGVDAVGLELCSDYFGDSVTKLSLTAFHSALNCTQSRGKFLNLSFVAHHISFQCFKFSSNSGLHFTHGPLDPLKARGEERRNVRWLTAGLHTSRGDGRQRRLRYNRDVDQGRGWARRGGQSRRPDDRCCG